MLAALVLSACSDGGRSLGDDAPPVVETYAEMLFAGYDDSVLTAEQLRDSLDPLLSGDATQEALAGARDAWRSARVPYQQTEYGRFYNGPIDDPAAGNVESLLNAWPLDEATMDYVQGPDDAPLYGGIINMPDDYPNIEEKLLEQENMLTGEENVTAGYHALEFLLWGQDFDPDGPGDRPHTDYVDGAQQNADRRREYLDVASQLLIDKLSEVRDAWRPGQDNYRALLLDMDPKDSIARILRGMGELSGSELPDERINTAYTSKDQEDEHSCFSDNTNADLTDDVLGLSNLYYGHYTRADGSIVEGPSLSDLVKSRDAELDARVSDQVDRTLEDIRAWGQVPDCPSAALQDACPFDQLLRGTDEAPGRQALKKVVNDLRTLSQSVVDIADLLGVDLDLADPGGE
jgi:putative iron-regulated protein